MKKNIALVTGGFSGEAVISYKTAATISAHIDRALFNVYVIDINLEGWQYETPEGKKIAVDKNDFTISPEGQKIFFDAVFIAMHGTPGEDGKLQGYFDTIGIPYTGCNAGTSAITFNKRYTIAVAGMSGMAVAKSVLYIKKNFVNAAEVIAELQFPVFVKPNNGGSSIGMSKVDSISDGLEAAIEKAFKEDEQVLVEEMIAGREFTVGVFKTEGRIIVLPITEVKALNAKGFFDFEAKYEGNSIETTPAVISEEVAEKIRAAASKVYALLNCKGVVRIDFIYNEEQASPYMLEINTIPGQTAASIVPQQVEAMGWSLKEFYTKIIQECFTN